MTQHILLAKTMRPAMKGLMTKRRMTMIRSARKIGEEIDCPSGIFIACLICFLSLLLQHAFIGADFGKLSFLSVLKPNLKDENAILHLRRPAGRPPAERVGFEPTVGINPRQFSRLEP
jgi:hypothetical protein